MGLGYSKSREEREGRDQHEKDNVDLKVEDDPTTIPTPTNDKQAKKKEKMALLKKRLKSAGKYMGSRTWSQIIKAIYIIQFIYNLIVAILIPLAFIGANLLWTGGDLGSIPWDISAFIVLEIIRNAILLARERASYMVEKDQSKLIYLLKRQKKYFLWGLAIQIVIWHLIWSSWVHQTKCTSPGVLGVLCFIGSIIFGQPVVNPLIKVLIWSNHIFELGFLLLINFIFFVVFTIFPVSNPRKKSKLYKTKMEMLKADNIELKGKLAEYEEPSEDRTILEHENLSTKVHTIPTVPNSQLEVVISQQPSSTNSPFKLKRDVDTSRTQPIHTDFKPRGRNQKKRRGETSDDLYNIDDIGMDPTESEFSSPFSNLMVDDKDD